MLTERESVGVMCSILSSSFSWTSKPEHEGYHTCEHCHDAPAQLGTRFSNNGTHRVHALALHHIFLFVPSAPIRNLFRHVKLRLPFNTTTPDSHQLWRKGMQDRPKFLRMGNDKTRRRLESEDL